MKKNKMMRRAAVLMVAVLMSTCAIGGTFAKYTTQDSGSDNARVAKWGVELQVVGNLYGDSYVDSIVKEDNSTLAVQSQNKSDDVVAPGTKNEEGFTFSLKGQPEVSGEITSTMKIQDIFLADNTYGVMIPVDSGKVTEANFDEFTDDLYTVSGTTYSKATAFASGETYYTLEDYVVVSADYYPVIYTLVGGTSYSSGALTGSSLKAVADAIANRLGITAQTADSDTSIEYKSTTTKKFTVNTDLADTTSINLDDEVITWAWAFDQSMDGADTILGMLENTTEGTVVKLSGSDYIPVVEYIDYCLDTLFSIDITVSQTDDGATNAA